MSVQTLSENPFIFRPHFSIEDLSLESPRPNEKRFVPSVFVPHTITSTVETNEARILFEYSIDEKPSNETIEFSPEVKILVGRYTKKIVAVELKYENITTIASLFENAAKAIKNEKKKIQLDSLRRNYAMAVFIIEKVSAEVRQKIIEFLLKQD